jgi:hypothetical protein
MADRSLEYLRKHCATDRQEEKLDAVISEGTYRGAAKAMGLALSAIGSTMSELKRRAASAGEGAHFISHEQIPDPLVIKGTSTLYKDGDPVAQWIKTTVDGDKLEEMVSAAIEAMLEDVVRATPVASPRACKAELANVYTLSDKHIGMLAWRKEGGEDWDLAIAEKIIKACFTDMVERSPDAETGIVAQLGDWLHYDSLQAVTPTSGHFLDADGRFAKMVQVAVRVLRWVIDLALAKHKKVVVVAAEGNHDIASSVWLRTMLAALYENEPRIEIVQNESPYYAYQHGKVMLVWHHGHLKKPGQIRALAAAQFSKMWGETEYRYAHLGDKHHLDEKDEDAMSVLQHSTLAARDAYASRHGWISYRRAMGITYHTNFGEIGRVTTTPEMVAEAA